tara:strand:- start:2770 stop:3324 length:555 start_codon:yes stop_codon:yes gene_type:complete
MQDSHKAIKARGDPTIADLIGKITEYDRLTLVNEWLKLFGTAPAKNTSSAILIPIITHELQCRAYGGLSAASKRSLRKELGNTYHKQSSKVVSNLNKASNDCDQIPSAKRLASQPTLLAAGTQLIREWNGRPYRVEVTDGGFTLDGNGYSSLSAIAKKITGTHWSGPRFFGLNKIVSHNRKAAQ